MQKISLDAAWLFARAGSENKTEVTLPHDAMLLEERVQESPGGKNTGYFKGADYVYERQLPLQKEGNSRYVVEFEGVYRNAKVYLNGEQIAFRPYGYTNFYVDITDYAEDGDNLLAVYAFNSDQPNSRWYSGAGIYRHVWLYVLPEKHILLNGVRVKTTDYAKGKILVSVKTSCAGNARVQILDGGTVVAEGETATGGACDIPLTVKDAKLWSPESPSLYTCRVLFEGDGQSVTFGIRAIECDSKRGLCINGKRVVLRGACIHHDNGVLGACAYDSAEERKVVLLQKAGYNALRSAHNPCSKALLDACDKHGMLVMDEYVDMWYIHKTKYDYVDYFEQWWRQDLADMVDKDFNHPSVVLYSTGNEVSETAQKRGIELCKSLTAYLAEKDGTRPVSCGINIFFNFLSSMGFGVYSDKKANKAPDKEVGSAFFNKLAGFFGDKTMKIGATLHGSDVKTRDAFANMDVAGYNYGILRYKKDVKRYPDRVILGSETFCKDAYTFYELAEQYPAIIGDFVWAGMDYLGEVGIGAWEYADYAKEFNGGVGWLTAGSGRVDITGRELGEALYTKVAFNLLPIAIAVVPADNATNAHSPSAWKMTNARESWSWNGCNGKTTYVEVYARADKIRLLVNGKTVGEKRAKKDCKVIFKTKYYDGDVTAVALDKEGRELCRTSLKTAGADTRLAMFAESNQPAADGLCYVRLQYTDKEGTVKPLARGEIKLKVENAKLLGFGNACPYNEAGYLKDTSDTYYGEAFAVLKSEGKGDIRVTAESRYGNAALTIQGE